MIKNVSITFGNKKTGAIPTLSRPMDTCPKSCPFLPDEDGNGGCYATGRIAYFAKTKSRDWSQDEATKHILDNVRRAATIMRDRPVGDVANQDQTIDWDYLLEIAILGVNTGLIPFGFTHTWKWFTREDVERLLATGYVMNASCETVEEVAQAIDLGFPAVITSDSVKDGDVINGKRVVTCLEQSHGITCMDCKLCAKANRPTIPRFLIHGTATNKARRAVAAKEAALV